MLCNILNSITNSVYNSFCFLMYHMLLITNIIWILTTREDNIENNIVTPRKTISTKAKPGLTWFSRGDNFPCYPLVQLLFIILYWMSIKYIVYITFGFKTIQVNWISYSVNLYANTTPVRIYGEPYAHISQITSRQAKSPVAKFHHVLGRGFMIQRVILIVIKSPSANQNQQFYIKV